MNQCEQVILVLKTDTLAVGNRDLYLFVSVEMITEVKSGSRVRRYNLIDKDNKNLMVLLLYGIHYS